MNKVIGEDKPKKIKEKGEKPFDSLTFVLPVVIGMVAILLILTGIEAYAKWRMDNEWQFPIKWIGLVKEREKEVVIEEVEVEKTKKIWGGKASWYGATPETCVGCNENFIMANGEKLDDRIRTIAFNELPLGSKVIVKNVDNGLEEIVEVTDTGGFDGLGRIADLSKALKESLKCGDLCSITIEEY